MESYEQFLARVNASAFIPPESPTGRPKGQRVMAKQVKLAKGKEFTFKSGKGAEQKYPWSEWLNGDLLLLEQSEGGKDEHGTVTTITKKKDFEVDPQAMRGKCKTAARKRYKVCQISFRDADGQKLEGSVIIRGRDMTQDERASEDMLRAEEKARQTDDDDDTDGDNAPPPAYPAS